jgi:hypothetical protein
MRTLAVDSNMAPLPLSSSSEPEFRTLSQPLASADIGSYVAVRINSSNGITLRGSKHHDNPIPVLFF